MKKEEIQEKKEFKKEDKHIIIFENTKGEDKFPRKKLKNIFIGRDMEMLFNEA